jgi:hypothetical protein
MFGEIFPDEVAVYPDDATVNVRLLREILPYATD